jgi:hypothetical protein
MLHFARTTECRLPAAARTTTWARSKRRVPFLFCTHLVSLLFIFVARSVVRCGEIYNFRKFFILVMILKYLYVLFQLFPEIIHPIFTQKNTKWVKLRAPLGFLGFACHMLSKAVDPIFVNLLLFERPLKSHLGESKLRLAQFAKATLGFSLLYYHCGGWEHNIFSFKYRFNIFRSRVHFPTGIFQEMVM